MAREATDAVTSFRTARLAARSTLNEVPQVRLGALTMLAMGWGSILPFALAALAPFVVNELGWSRTRYGTLITLSFVFAMLFSTWAGSFTDRTRRSATALLVLFVTACLSLIIVSLGTTYAVMAVGAVLGGVSISLTNPSTNKLVSAYGARGARGLMVGIKQSGVQAGTFLTGVLLPPLAHQLGWRGALRVAAMFPLILAVVGLFSFPARWPRRVGPASDESPRRIWWLMTYAFLMGGGIAAATYYVPLYAHEGLGYPESSAGIFLSAIGVTGMLSRIAAGHFADRIGDASKLLVTMPATAIAAQILIWLAAAHGSAFLWAGTLLFGAGAVAWNAIAMLVVLQRFGFGGAGRSSGAVSLAFYGGLVVTPTAFGALVDRTGTYAYGWLMAIILFVGAVTVALMGSISDRKHH